jgi:hypothetical protein
MCVCAKSLGAGLTVCVCVMGVQVAHDVVVFTARRMTESVRCPDRVACRLCMSCMSDSAECAHHRVALPLDGCSVLV